MELSEGAYQLVQLIFKHFKKQTHNHKCKHDHQEKNPEREVKNPPKETSGENVEKYSVDYSKW